jgi:hypothetical protein
MEPNKLKTILEGAFLALDLELNSPSDRPLSATNQMAIAREKLSTALMLLREEPVKKSSVNAYPEGLKGQEEVINAVMEAVRALFSCGLSPEENKQALVILRDYINNLLDKEEKD